MKLGRSMKTCNTTIFNLPSGTLRDSRCSRLNYRYVVQVFALAMVSCTLLLYQISVLAEPHKDSHRRNRNANEIDSLLLRGPKESFSFPGESVNTNSNENYLYSDDVDSYYYNSDEGELGAPLVSKDGLQVKVELKNNEVKTLPRRKVVRKGKKKFSSKKLAMDYYQRRKKLLESMFLSVKTTERFHESRIRPIVDTWFKLASEQVKFLIGKLILWFFYALAT